MLWGVLVVSLVLVTCKVTPAVLHFWLPCGLARVSNDCIRKPEPRCANKIEEFIPNPQAHFGQRSKGARHPDLQTPNRISIVSVAKEAGLTAQAVHKNHKDIAAQILSANSAMHKGAMCKKQQCLKSLQEENKVLQAKHLGPDLSKRNTCSYGR